MSDAVRFDRGEIRGSAVRTDEGYIRADAVVTRTGVFLYRNADGSVRRELRHPDQVFEKASLDSMKLIPITNGHPGRLVNAESAKELGIGQTGENITIDGKYVMIPLAITAADGVEDVDAGKKELSLGYTVDLVKEDGIYNGERYDYRQTNIRYNHLAIVERARAGAEARINLDAADAVQLSDGEGKMEKILKTVVLDGIEYQAAPEVVNALQRAIQRGDAAEAAQAKAESDRDSLQAKLDEAQAKIEELEALRDDTSKLQEAVKARLELERTAAKFLPKDAKLDGLTDRQVREAVIKAKHPKFDGEGLSDVYVQARFDAIVESEPTRDDLAIQRQRRLSAVKVDGQGERDDAEEARKKAHETITGMWSKSQGDK